MDIEARKELLSSIRFFLETSSKKEPTYGLVPDVYPSAKHAASIAGTGFYFAALMLAAEYGLLSKEEAEGRALKALSTLEGLESKEGFYYHFYDLDTGEKCEFLELSSIDSALLFAGMLTAGGYFKGDVLKKALAIFARANFRYFLHDDSGYLSMAVDRKGRFVGHWDIYAEQLILYVLGASSPDPGHRLGKDVYYAFRRPLVKYGNEEFVGSWHGSLFTFQFSQAYVDFHHIVDEEGVNWFTNSVHASRAAYQYALDNEGKFKSFHRDSWGLTACLGRNGYTGLYGSPPTGLGKNYNDGTVSPSAAIGSIVFTPKESLSALRHYVAIPRLMGRYGLYDSYNEDQDFFAERYVSIDKGIGMLMLSNYDRELVWKHFNALPLLKEGLSRLGFREE